MSSKDFILRLPNGEKLHLRLPKDFFETIEKTAKDNNISVNTWMIQAIEHRLTCKKADQTETPTLKPILAKYPSTCKQCSQPIPIGTRALWSKGVIICMDCYIQSLGDKALASKYLKMRELNKIVHALEKEANQYADFINDIKLQVRFGEIIKKLDQLLDLNDKYLHTFDEQTIKEINDFMKELKKDLPELKIAVVTKMQPIKKARRVEY